MSKFKKRSLNRYGLALLMIVGAGLVVAASRSGADEITWLNSDCWLQGTEVCSSTYYSSCLGMPDGDACYRCPYALTATTHCINRDGYMCRATTNLPYNCGPRLYGICLYGECYGDLDLGEVCTILQCTGDTP